MTSISQEFIIVLVGGKRGLARGWGLVQLVSKPQHLNPRSLGSHEVISRSPRVGLMKAGLSCWNGEGGLVAPTAVLLFLPATSIPRSIAHRCRDLTRSLYTLEN